MRGRRLVVLTAAGATAVLTMASMAWACTNFIRIEGVSPSVERPASSVEVRGVQAVAHSTVGLRWNRIDGPVLAEARADAAGSFAATMDVPQVAPGIYVITATSEGNVARAAMEVGLAGVLSRSDASVDLSSVPDGTGTDAGTGMTVLAVGLLLLASGALVLSARRGRPVAAPAAATPAGPGFSAERLEDLVEVGR